MKECIFCDLSKKKREIIYEDEYFFSTFDHHPVSPGHALIIPKRHVVSLLDLKDKEWSALKSAISNTIKKIESTNLKKIYQDIIREKPTKKSPWFCSKMIHSKNINKKPGGYNIGNNEGIIAGRTIHHLHIQIIPRYKGDVKNPVGGIRNIIPKMGNYR